MASSSAAASHGRPLSMDQWRQLTNQLHRINREHSTGQSQVRIRLRCSGLYNLLTLGRSGVAQFDDEQALRQCATTAHRREYDIEFANGTHTVTPSALSRPTLQDMINKWCTSINDYYLIVVEFVFDLNDPHYVRNLVSVPGDDVRRESCSAALRHPAVLDFAQSCPQIADEPQINLSVLPCMTESGSTRVTFLRYPSSWLDRCNFKAQCLTNGFQADSAWRELRAAASSAQQPVASVLRAQDVVRLLSGRAASAGADAPYRSAWTLPGALPYSYLPDAVLGELSSFLPDNVEQPEQVLSQIRPHLLMPEGHSLVFINQGTGQRLDFNQLRVQEWRRLFVLCQATTEGSEYSGISIGWLTYGAFNEAARSNNAELNARIALSLSTQRDPSVADDFVAQSGTVVLGGANVEQHSDDGLQPQDDTEELLQELENLATDAAAEWEVCRIGFELDMQEMQVWTFENALQHPWLQAFAAAFPCVADSPSSQLSVVAYKSTDPAWIRVEFMLYRGRFTRDCQAWTRARTGGLDCRQAWLDARASAGGDSAAKRQRKQ